MSPPPRGLRIAPLPILAALLLTLTACAPRAKMPTPAPGAPLRERIAALVLRQNAFGAVSLIPVRFERSRISKPFLDGGRTLHCVSTRMYGRDFDEPERPRIVIEERGGAIAPVDEDEEICHGHRTEPFPELDTPEPGMS